MVGNGGNGGNGVEGFQTPPGMDAKDMIMIIAARGGLRHFCNTVAIVQQWVNGADLLPELPRHLTY